MCKRLVFVISALASIFCAGTALGTRYYAFTGAIAEVSDAGLAANTLNIKNGGGVTGSFLLLDDELNTFFYDMAIGAYTVNSGMPLQLSTTPWTWYGNGQIDSNDPIPSTNKYWVEDFFWTFTPKNPGAYDPTNHFLGESFPLEDFNIAFNFTPHVPNSMAGFPETTLIIGGAVDAPAPVPEPSSLILIGCGSVLLIALRKRVSNIS